MIKLRPYQKHAINNIKYTFESQCRQYIEMPTGSGKTITFLTYASQNHQNILIIVPSRQLMHQVYDTCLLFYHKSEISRRGDNHTEAVCKVHICIIHSIRGDYLKELTGHSFDLVIIDEAHHTQAKSYRRFIDLLPLDSKILGVTATPDRMDGQLLDQILHTKSYKAEIYDLIEKGYLSDIEGFSVKTNIDISDLDDHNGDFSIPQLYKRLGTKLRNKMVLDLCLKEMKNRKTLVFCINIQHSKEIVAELKNLGIAAAHIDGQTPDKQKQVILKAFRNGQISVLCNCQLLTEGFDEPTIDGIILARPTRSRALFLQMVGRGLRIAKGKKNCKIIDLVDNHKNLSGFNSLLTESRYREIEEFKKISDIKSHLEERISESIESKIERVNLLNLNPIDEIDATESMIEYLQDNNIKFYEPISCDEASFIIWKNELKKRFYGSN